ncbi:unnamed protein product [Soboliphyme baturini]|uniref:Uncharacterized protein n=1 Tax=Soboliphyme baturini TaxID=241478 RepID=A0A183IZ67_9BILA|nr:unnamed protein product [Soboliphyme baturini]
MFPEQKENDAEEQSSAGNKPRRRKRRSAALRKQLRPNREPSPPPDVECRIFSKHFVEHNRQREGEMRKKRMELLKQEREKQQLEATIKTIQEKVDDEEANVDRLKRQSASINKALNIYRQAAVAAIEKIHRDGTGLPAPTVKNIETYLRLASNVNKVDRPHAAYFSAVREAMCRLRLPTVCLDK